MVTISSVPILFRLFVMGYPLNNTFISVECRLRWHRSILKWFKELNTYFCKIKIPLEAKLSSESLVSPTPLSYRPSRLPWVPVRNPLKFRLRSHHAHYSGVIKGTISSQITSLTIVYSIVYSDADQRKHLSSAPLAFVLEIHRGPVNSPHKWPVTRKMFPFDDVIMRDTGVIWDN